MSKIEWTDVTWNPTTGCNKVSQGCKFCYAEVMHKRLAVMQPNKYGKPFLSGVQLHEDELNKPMQWKKPKMVFVNSMSDLFHEDVPFDFIDRVFNEMIDSGVFNGHTFQVLTKRADRLLKYYQERCEGWMSDPVKFPHVENIWIGVSCEDQKAADERIPYLLKIPAPVKFLSCEPLLGPIDFLKTIALSTVGRNRTVTALDHIQWVIVGGESGNRKGVRPMHPDWVRSLRDQCKTANVPFFFKQWGNWNPDNFDTTRAKNVDDEGTLMYWQKSKSISGNFLDGVQHIEFPAVTN